MTARVVPCGVAGNGRFLKCSPVGVPTFWLDALLRHRLWQRCHLSGELPPHPPHRPYPSRPRLERHDRGGTVSALGADFSPTRRASIALVVTRRDTLAVDTHDRRGNLPTPLLLPQHVPDPVNGLRPAAEPGSL